MKCPICETQQSEQTKVCTVCGYDLTPYPVVVGQIPLDFLEKEKKRIAWCKELWQKSKAETKKLKISEARVNTLEKRLKEMQEKSGKEITSVLEFSGDKKQKIASLDLTSEISKINYQRLRQLLSEKRWKDADIETAHKIWEVMKRNQEKFLRSEDIKAFPEKDLKIIDSLWFEHSEGQFGFRVQNRIWQDCGSPKASHKTWNEFAENVGWRGKIGWASPHNINTDEIFHKGSFPFAWWGHYYWTVLRKNVFQQGINDWISLISRIDK